MAGSSVDDVHVTLEQQGNYFIMDSEQLVTNPFQQLQTEAIDSVKKTSLTEKLTAVKNNVCEVKFKSKASHLEREKLHKLRQLHIDSNNLRYEVKLMDITRRKHNLEMQKRIEPEKDFSYDSNQIKNSAKRLGVVSHDSCYLDRKLKYPLRGNILRDHNAKPIIQKARQAMVEHRQTKKQEMEERATTSQTMSTTINIPSSASTRYGRGQQRRGSKSAPPISKHFQDTSPSRPDSTVQGEDETDTKLPSIHSTMTHTRSKAASHVKFLLHEPSAFRQSTPEGLYRSKTFHSGMTRHSYSEPWDSDDDEDYTHSERVDLHALFFGNKSHFDSTGAATPRTLTRQSTDVPIIMRAQSAKPITEERLKQENKQLREKIDRFLGNIYSEDQLKAIECEKEKERQKAKEEEEEKEKPPPPDSRSKATTLLNIFSKPLEPRKQWGYKSPVPKEENVDETDKGHETPEDQPKSPQADKTNKRNLWELIKTEMNSGNIRDKYTANDLILQQLTGILVQSSKKNVIPIHSASRALRHTPTFKMRKVVEQLTKQRTRYEQQEIEKLQKNQGYGEGGMYGENGEHETPEGVQHYPPRTWATPSRQQQQET